MIKALHRYFTDEKLLEKWGTTDVDLCARIHLFKTMQQQRFGNEIMYLKDPKNNQLPDLVRSKSLYLDKYGLLRSSGRHDKCAAYDKDVTNPILIAKDHDLTKLVIEDAHRRCQHLGIDATVKMIRFQDLKFLKQGKLLRT